MCRDIAIDIINDILEDIYNGISIDRIRTKCEEFKRKCDYEDLQIEEEEIRKERVNEYIKFFSISGICEYDIFKDRNTFYRILKENLEVEKAADLERFMEAGGFLSDYIIA